MSRILLHTGHFQCVAGVVLGVCPMEKIKDIKILQVNGLGGFAGGANGAEGVSDGQHTQASNGQQCSALPQPTPVG